jgi:plastocyanin
MDTKTIVATLALLAGAASCSLADDPTTTRQASQTAPTSSSSSDDSSAGSTAAAPAAVDPREGGLQIGFGEFAITLETQEIRPGPVTFVVRNRGALVHGFEMEIEGRDGSGSGSGDGFKLEGRLFGPGETLRFPMRLAPGVYEIECFVAEHDDMGMRAFLVVRRGAPLVREERTAPDVVEISDFSFPAGATRAEVGSEVTWTNADPAQHTVTATDGSFDSGPIAPNGDFSVTFDQVGTFAYRCEIHPTMEGSVRVVSSS